MNKEKIKQFWKTAEERQLRDLLKYAKDKKVRMRALKHYNFSKAKGEQLRDLLLYVKDKKAIMEALKYYDFSKAEKWQLRDLVQYADDDEVKMKAQEWLAENEEDVFEYLKNKG